MAASSARRICDAAFVSMAVSIAKSMRLCRRQVDGDGYGMRNGCLAGPFALAEAEINAANYCFSGHMRRVAGNGECEGQGEGFGDAVQAQAPGRDIGVAPLRGEAGGFKFGRRELVG